MSASTASAGPIVIVGVGQAAAVVARQLRKGGATQRIVMIGQERHPPYERPPLSKAVLEQGEAALPWLLSPQDLKTLAIEHRAGQRVLRIDRERREVLCEGGEVLGYGALVLATGGRARRLPGLDSDDEAVHSLRTLDDALALHAQLRPGRQLLVVGGGWIGLEVAAVARARSMAVTVIEAAPRLCQRALAPQASQFLFDLHRGRGVEVMLGCSVQGLRRLPDGRRTLELGDGRQLAADLVLVGAGLVPNGELAAEAGLAMVHDAVRVDARGRTSDPHIHAAGDVSCFASRWAGHDQPLRLESWANAQAQGLAVACDLSGAEMAPEEVPTFWSEQYELSLQMAGLPSPGAVQVARIADPAKPVWLQCEGGRVTGVVAVSSPREFRAARKLIERGVEISPERLADPAERLDRL